MNMTKPYAWYSVLEVIPYLHLHLSFLGDSGGFGFGGSSNGGGGKLFKFIVLRGLHARVKVVLAV